MIRQLSSLPCDRAAPSVTQCSLTLARIPLLIGRLNATPTQILLIERGISVGGAIVTMAVTLFAMAAWLNGSVHDGDSARRGMDDHALRLITPTTSAGVRPEQWEQGGRAGSAPAEPVQGTSPVDVSTPHETSILEWRVTRMAAPATSAPTVTHGTGGEGAGIGAAQGAAQGGVGVFDPYAGASPDYRQPQNRAETTPPTSVLQALQARARGIRGQFRCQMVPLSARRVTCTWQSGGIEAAQMERWVQELWPAAPAGDFTVTL